MKYTLSCGDAVPGRSARFEEDSRHRILELVPEMLQEIDANIVPV